MKGNEIGSDVPGEPEDLFEMANLYPSTTGLPMTVWVSPRGNAHHELRVRVNVTHGNQIDIADTVRRSASYQLTTRSITSSTSVAITSLPPSIELPGPKNSRSGPKSAVWVGISTELPCQRLNSSHPT